MGIREIEYGDIPEDFKYQAQKARVSFSEKPEVLYWGYFEEDRLVGLTSLVIYKNHTGRIKASFVLPEYRGKGIFSKLNSVCLNQARSRKLKQVLLNCLPDSVSIHEKNGAVVYKKTKTITYMVYRLWKEYNDSGDN